MLEVQDITFSYQKNGNQILEHVNLSVGPEDRPWDSCTERLWQDHTVKIISGCISPDAGRILVDGELLPQKGYCPVQMIFPASGTGSQSTTSHARGAKRRRWASQKS